MESWCVCFVALLVDGFFLRNKDVDCFFGECGHLRVGSKRLLYLSSFCSKIRVHSFIDADI